MEEEPDETTEEFYENITMHEINEIFHLQGKIRANQALTDFCNNDTRSLIHEI